MEKLFLGENKSFELLWLALRHLESFWITLISFKTFRVTLKTLWVTLRPFWATLSHSKSCWVALSYFEVFLGHFESLQVTLDHSIAPFQTQLRRRIFSLSLSLIRHHRNSSNMLQSHNLIYYSQTIASLCLIWIHFCS